ncbi:hypothetical protein AB833_14535 [Chromatiales bacterium (ex Bugula neritina AB1)]|nr:hypothetical protein AB833_14535 [Chromatiales bacterium (ex Bugula neritina AB1)]
MLRIFIAALVVVAVLLQWRFWLGDGGIRELSQSGEALTVLAEELAAQQDINTALRAEVVDLAEGVGEIEERARSELGMIGSEEVFYQFVGTRNDEPGGNLAQVRVTSDRVSVTTNEVNNTPVQ